MIQTKDSIRASARQAVDALNTHGTPPINPHPVGSEAHKEWALSFYEAALELEMSEQ